MNYLERKDRKIISITFLQSLFVGIIVGVVFFFLFKNSIFQDTNFWLNEMMQYSKYAELEKTNYFLFLIKQRIKNFLSVILCTIIWNYRISMLIVSFGIGITIGIFLCICIRRWGLIGIVLCFFAHMPQDILYFIALSLWGKIEKRNTEGPRTIFYTGFNKKENMRKVLQYMLITAVSIIGMIIEYYVNILLLHKIIIIFENIKYHI